MAHITDELKIVTDPAVPIERKRELIIAAGKAGYISNLLSFIGNVKTAISLQLLIIRITGKRERNFDLVCLLRNHDMPPLVRKAVEEALFENVKTSADKGFVSDMHLFMDSQAVPEEVKIHARRLLGLAVDNATSKGFYLGFPELLGKSWVSEDVKLKAFDHWEKGRATDLDLELLLRRNNLCQPLKMRVVSALFKRGAASRVPERLRLKKIQEGKKGEQGLLLQLRDFIDSRKGKEKPSPMPIRNVQIRIRRRNVC